MTTQQLIPLPQLSSKDISKRDIENFKRKFEFYLIANELDKKSEVIRVAHLRCGLDSETNDIVDKLSPEQMKVENIFNHIKTELLPKDNTCYKQYCFFNRKQVDGESFNQFYMEVDKLGQECDFGEKYDQVLKAKLVCGIYESNLRERLMRSPDMTLKEVINYCRLSEDTKQKMEIIENGTGNGNGNGSQVMAIQNSRKNFVRREQASSNMSKASSNKPPWAFKTKEQQPKGPIQQKYKCSKCLTWHIAKHCPAYNKACLYCHKLNHFSVACRFKRRKVQTLQNQEDSDLEDDEMCGVISILSLKQKDNWLQMFKFGNVEVKFKLDSGADVNVLPVSVVNSIDRHLLGRMISSKMSVEAFGGRQLKVLGTVRLQLSSKTQTRKITFSIMQDGKGIIPILGREACVKLGLIKRLDNINESQSEMFDENKFLEKYKDVFEGLGKFPQTYKISIDETEKPTIKPPRRVAFSLLEKLKITLNKLTDSKIIEPVNQPKNWCSNLVIVEKPSGDLRLCLDPTDLNKCIKREYFLIPTLDEIKTKLAGKKYFSVIDLKDGFHQIGLHEESKDLCTFSTPLGYYRYLRIPFGIKTGPEVFMKFNTECFKDIEDLCIYFDDLLIASADKVSHFQTLNKVFKRAKDLNIKINKSKLQLVQTEFRYLGHIFNEAGCQLDPDRIQAIKNLKEPKNVKELQSVLGMLNYMREFIPNMAENTAPLRVLLKRSTDWHWTDHQQSAFDNLKKVVSSSTIIQNFDPNKDVIIQTDSSQYGIGCCLLQDNKPVSFASKSLTENEKKWPQIDKEGLAIKFACRKFHNYIWGKKIQVQTDHLPLVSIFRKNISEIVSERLIKIRLSLLRYDLDVNYLPGKQMYIADLLSRNLSSETDDNDNDIVGYVHNIYKQENLLDLDLIKTETEKDQSLKEIIKFCIQGWPSTKSELPNNEITRHFFKIKNELIFSENLLCYNDRIVIPQKLKQIALNTLHLGHLGINKTTLRASQTYYWININNDIQNFIKNCMVCQENRPIKIKEPLLPHELPERPFQKISLDIMFFNGQDYLVIFDNYSKWIELCKLKSKKCSEIIEKLKTTFLSFGLPDIIFSDNSPFLSNEIKTFSNEYKIEWRTSSPHYPISNGHAERAVQTCKDILKKAQNLKIDYRDLLMEYKATPISTIGISPSEMIMGRLIKTKMLINSKKLNPIQNLGDVHKDVKIKLKLNQSQNKKYYDRNCREETEFREDENILLHEGNKWVRGKILNKTMYPRSYNVKTERGQILRRNSRFIKPTSIKFSDNLYLHNTQNSYDDLLENRVKSNTTSSSIPENSLPISVNENSLPISVSENSLTVSVGENTLPIRVDENGLAFLSGEIPDDTIVASIEGHSVSEETVVGSSNVDRNNTSNISFKSAENTPYKTPPSHDHNYVKTSRRGRVIIKPSRLRL